MKIFNSCTNKMNDLTNLKQISIYNCGPTVYNYIHIGNARPLVIFDVLHRYLLEIGKEVKYIQNITDVDDKIINAAAQQNVPEHDLTVKYIKAYKDVFTLLNVKEVMMPKVSEHILDIIAYIQKLIDAKVAYVVEGDVYFDVSCIKDYGHISHQNIDELLDGVRKENKSIKKSPLDFALWKKTDVGLNWQSPWSVGRPGWHTECCVLINKYIGECATIHGGGVDLKFPHHENENAQNEALFKKDIAETWMHVGHVNVNGVKMAKSLGNFILVNDLVNKDNANGLRWFFYQAKYEQPINYTKELFEKAVKEINNLLYNYSIAKTHLIANGQYKPYRNPLGKNFSAALEDDLNLPNAITAVMNDIKELNKVIREKNFEKANDWINSIAHELDILGINYSHLKHDDNVHLILEWKEASDAKDYAKADEIRKQLVELKLL